ncbi:MAG TPA: NAD(P)/FAD-dependent oxidoreductase [Acidimicrobiales bacterium]|nr:NAD(P)/FAD-dependent oxidoreductase [Acidimicrobiales bacterium]
MSDRTDAVVVGSGPNGLAAAIELAQAGLSVTVFEAASTVGGGARSAELTVPGVLHDICSAAHPFAMASPFFASLPLADHGLEWCRPEIDLVHPLDGGDAVAMHRSLDTTVDGLGREDGKRWRRRFGPSARHLDDLAPEFLGPLLHVPRHPVLLARFGMSAMQPATWVARSLGSTRTQALFAGSAAHVFRPLDTIASASVGVAMVAVCHRHGWPVARGGSQAITDALVSCLESLGGRVVTDHRVTSFAEVDDARVRLFDVAPSALAELAGDRLPARVRRAYRRFRHGPAAFKVDLTVRDGIPWAAEAARSAGTLHLGGTLEQIATAEAEVAAGRMPERPFMLVGQQYLADPSRSAGDLHPIWAYAHVPHAYDGDATEAIIAQIERFAPGVRDRIVATVSHGPAQLAEMNPNFIGGDIGTGANDLGQLLFRPRAALDPYATGIPGTALCSAATPPGAGVHGMCGQHAARSALRTMRR